MPSTRTRLFLLLGLLASFALPTTTCADGVFSYVDDAGKTHYVGSRSQIPDRYRKEDDAVDLRHVSTNQKLGTDLKKAAATELERRAQAARLDAIRSRLADHPVCVEARDTAEGASYLKIAIERYPHLLAFGVLALLLVFLSPRMARLLPPGQWARLMMMVLPMLGVMAMLGTAAVRSSMAMKSLKADAEACSAPGEGLPGSVSVGAVNKRQGMVRRVRHIFQKRQQRMDDALAEVGIPSGGGAAPPATQ